jgi:probable phosphomutase (TIGR03848 family)
MLYSLPARRDSPRLGHAMTQFLLIRHAHNDWVNHRLAGWTPGVHLNDQGRAEARALAERLSGYRIDALFTSPLERAQETAAYLAEPRGLTVQSLDGIGEVRYGEWTGRELKVLKDEPLWRQVQHHPSRARFPGGETLGEVQARAVAALEAVAAEYPEAVVAAVSHGDVIKAIVAHYVGAHLDMFQRLSVGTASLSIVRVTEQGPCLLMFNDTGTVPPPPEPARPADAAAAAGDAA